MSLSTQRKAFGSLAGLGEDYVALLVPSTITGPGTKLHTR